MGKIMAVLFDTEESSVLIWQAVVVLGGLKNEVYEKELYLYLS